MKILIADDQPLERRVLRMTLEKAGYDVEECEDGTQALEQLSAPDAPKLAILDWMMPGLSGPEICQQLRERQTEPYTFIILVTSRDDTDDIVEGMEAGADDYIVKPVKPLELQVRLRAGRRIIELQDELIAAREDLREQATRDFLTKVWNRAAIMEKIGDELHRARRSGESIGIIMGDIDHFKQINDTHGHAAGDAVLREVAARISGALRGYDMVGRYGGEEFLVLVPNAETGGAVAVAERIRSSIANAPVTIDGTTLNVTMSLGAYAAPVDDTTHAELMIATADAALYEAKDSGRNRVCSSLERIPAV